MDRQYKGAHSDLFTDLFCRGRGWSQTFGVTYVDRDNDFERISKDSTRLLKQVWEHVVARDT